MWNNTHYVFTRISLNKRLWGYKEDWDVVEPKRKQRIAPEKAHVQ